MKQNQQESACKYIPYATKEGETHSTKRLSETKQHRHNVLRKERTNAHISDQEKKETVPKNSAPPGNIRKAYLRSKKLLWYWATLATAFATMLATFMIHENAFPVTYARWVLGLIFVVFLPGHSLVRSLQVQRRLNSLEFLCLSIGTSLALVSIFGLILDQTPLGVSLTTVTFGLLAITVTSSTVAVIRDFKEDT